MAQMVKNLPAMQTQFDPWVGKNTLEKGMATHSSYSCLENPMDRGAWRATVLRVTKSQTRLKRLSTQMRTHFKNNK